MKINIIGAGPVGAYTAYLLSKQGHQVNLFEEHQRIGQPIQCTGLVTDSFFKFVKPKKEFITNIIKQYRLISPSNKQAPVNKKEYVLDRTALDQYLANLAQNNGSQLHLSHHFLDQKNNHLIFKNKNKIIKIKQSITIGADGPLSRTTKVFQFPNQSQFYYGYQACIKDNFDPKTIHVGFGQKIAPHFFSWVVPENEYVARIGLATLRPNKSYFNQLIRKYKKNIICLQAGLIPIYNPKTKIQHQNTYLIGDAATQVKATTGGGLIPGLQAAQCLAQALDQNKDYSQLCQKNINPNLKKHLLIRKTLNKFKDKDYDYLIKVMQQKHTKEFIQKYNRENLKFTQLFKLFLKEPKIAYFAKHLLT